MSGMISYCYITPLETVEGACIVVEDLLDHAGAYRAISLDRLQRVDLGGAVGVSVVRPDDEVVLAHVANDLGKVIIGLAGHPDAIVFEEVILQGSPRALQAPGEVVNRIREPLRAQLDKSKAQP